MAFNPNVGRAEYTATAGQTLFTYTFKVYATSDIKVYLTPVGQAPNDTNDILTETTHYTVTIDGDNGGTVTLVTPATLGDKVTFKRDLATNRSIEYQKLGDMSAATLNLDQDYQTYLIADQEQTAKRHISIPVASQGVSTLLPDVSPDSYLVWNSEGTALVNDTTVPDSVATTAANVVAAQLAETNAETAETNAGNSATQAQLRAWEAEAERLTADSYATEAEDVPVNIVTSDGDGTFTYTPTSPAEYSAFHYSKKALVAGVPDTIGNSGKFLIVNNAEDTEWSTVHNFKNKLINGDFKINQRVYISGTATTSANEYTLDRWRVVTLGQALTLSETNGIVTITAPLDGIEQVIEPLLAGTYTFGKASGTATITVSESADNITYAPITPNADGSYTVTGYNYVKVNIKNGTATFVQFEEGNTATPFENRPIGVELDLCKRYYEKSYDESVAPGTVTTTGMKAVQLQYNAGVYHVNDINYKIEKRVPPSVITYGLNGTANSMTIKSVDYSSTLVASGTSGFSVRFTAVQNGTTGQLDSYMGFQWVSDAEL